MLHTTANYVFLKELRSKVYKEHWCFNRKGTNNSVGVEEAWLVLLPEKTNKILEKFSVSLFINNMQIKNILSQDNYNNNKKNKN